MAKKSQQLDPAAINFQLGYKLVSAHPLFDPLLEACVTNRERGNPVNPQGWAYITAQGVIFVHPSRRAEPAEWAYVLAHCVLHLGFEHFQERPQPALWNAACDCVNASFLAALKFGQPPDDFGLRLELGNNEETIYRYLSERGLPAGYYETMLLNPRSSVINYKYSRRDPPRWPEYLATGLANAVSGAVDYAAGLLPEPGRKLKTAAQRAREWFINSYPLLGALAAAFTIIESTQICQRMEISVAAVDMLQGEIYINPAAGLEDDELRFVMAHELLHVGLRHDVRCQGRDPYLWNVACDYVINGWLVEMGVGTLPQLGLLYDPTLKGMSAEAIYDTIATDMRRFRKLATLRGKGLSDILGADQAVWWEKVDVDLDAFYRRCLSQGLTYYESGARGLLPAGLIEEIRALEMPVIPWDVQLARWFEHHFPPVEKRRTYARPSRRQAATPDIPRPSYVVEEQPERQRTFGVVLDTSGSMQRQMLARALGTIASYSMAHDVALVRVVFCDAAAYDQGYLAPEAIADRVKIRGRGGTILQPGIDLLEHASDFPADGPILIITDGWCDRVVVQREHAYVLPKGQRLPFLPRGEVFMMNDPDA